MRKIEQEMIKAIKYNASWSKGNTQVIQKNNKCEVYLHGNKIAVIHDDTKTMDVSNCGWETPTTRSRLDALLCTFSVQPAYTYQKNFTQYLKVGDEVIENFVEHKGIHIRI